MQLKQKRNLWRDWVPVSFYQVSKEDTVPELTATVAGVVLTLMSNLRQCFFDDPGTDSKLANTDSATRYIGMLDPAAVSTASIFAQASGERTLFASSLQVVLRGLIEHLLRSSKYG